MKTRQIISFLLISFIVVCCSKETEKENPVPENILKQEEAKPGNLISLEKAKEHIENYKYAHPEEVGNQYAVRTWISIQELKEYIRYIEQESKAKDIEVSGIDFIHAQYKKAEPGSANPNNEVYDLTLMMAPTYREGNTQKAFDPLYSEQRKPKSLQSLFDEITINTGPSEKDKTGNGSMKPSSIGNNLNTCPTVCTQN